MDLTPYLAFYNGERAHQGLDHRTPNFVYESGEGGGTIILNKYGSVTKLTILISSWQKCFWFSING